VLFDINRFADVEPLLKRDPRSWFESILRETDRSFTVSVVSNGSERTPEVVLRGRRPGDAGVTTSALGLAWPRGLYSLAHVSLPFRRMVDRILQRERPDG
jgi:hypothetical protein